MEEKENVKEKVNINLGFLKSKVTVGIGSILLGIMVSFVFTPLYNQSLKEKVNIIQVSKKIEKGQKITDDMVKVVSVGSYNLANNIITNKSEVVGKYAVTNLYEKEYIVTERLSDKPIAQDEYLENLDGEQGAVSITLQSFAAGLSGKLFPKDIVSIIVTEDTNTYIPPELKYVQVLACTLENGNDIDENTKSEADEDADVVADTITLLVNSKQAKLLANLEANQKVHVELVYRGTEETRNKYLKQQDKIIKEIIKEQKEDSDGE